MWLLIYPLKGTGPMILGLWAVVGFIVAAVSLTGILGSIALTFATAILLLYVGDSNNRVSLGYTAPRSVGAADVNPMQQPSILLPTLALLPLCWFARDLSDSWPTVAIAVAAVFILAPAWFIAITDGLASATTPRLWWHLVRGLGFAYPLFALLITGALASLVAAFAFGHPAGFIAASYLLVLLHIAAARLLWARRAALDLYTEVSPEQRQQAEDDQINQEWLDFFDELHRLARADEIRQAHTKLDIRLKRDHYARDEWVHDRLSAGDQRLYLEHAYHYIDRLVASAQPSAAWLICREALDSDPLFRPSSAATLMTLVEGASHEQGAHVELLLADFESRFAGSDEIPRALFFRARTQFRDLADPHAASRTLQQLRQQFPEAAQRKGVKNLHTAVERAISSTRN